MRYAQQSVIEADLLAVANVMRSDWLTCGPKIEEFEAALCAYTGAKYAVAVSSGTAALHLAYLASGYRAIVTTPLTFVATANAALLSDMGVNFVDVERDTGNMAQHYRSGLIVPVHYAGRAVDLRRWSADKIIEDACHALGARYQDGPKVGSCVHSRACCFSFHPVKPITTLGEGGAMTTNEEWLADMVRSLRSHGRHDGNMIRLGMNYRMTDAAAAMGIEQLKRCDHMRARRAAFATQYGALLRGLPVVLPEFDLGNAWHLYPIRIKNGRRDEVKAKLNAQGIGVQVHYNPIVPLQPYYRERFGYNLGDFPEAEAWAAEELSLPLHSGMTEADVERVVKALRESLG